jgi:hypothetical protein
VVDALALDHPLLPPTLRPRSKLPGQHHAWLNTLNMPGARTPLGADATPRSLDAAAATWAEAAGRQIRLGFARRISTHHDEVLMPVTIAHPKGDSRYAQNLPRVRGRYCRG